MTRSAGEFLDALRMAGHLAVGMPRFFSHSLVHDHTREALRERIARWSRNFLDLLENAVYPFPHSPYSRLLKAAGCELEDVRRMVQVDGLEGALQSLRRAGVFVTLDEFKGRCAMVRGSDRWHCSERDFDNPRLRSHFQVSSGGTRSAGTRTIIDLDFIAAMAMDTSVLFDAHDLWPHEQAIWLPLGGTALVALMMYARLRRPPARWLSQVDGHSSRLSFQYRAGTALMLSYGRLFCQRMARPEYVSLQDAGRVAGWIAEMRQQSRVVCMTTFASSAVRICCEARRMGLDIRGAAFVTIGEPLTTARRALIEAAGARAVCRYAITEAGILGYACADSSASDDVHFLRSNLALIQAQRAVPQGDPVDALYLTSLVPAAPKILINAETGDYARVEERTCSCAFGALGYATHLSNIRSFEKLTGEGVTFAGSDLVRILDEVFPARFGGDGVDYQIVEEHGSDGLPRLFILANPAIGSIDQQSIVTCFLDELAK